MTNYICINGKKAELTEEQMKALGIELPKVSPFERAPRMGNYYFITDMGNVNQYHDMHDVHDEYRYKEANYCTDKTIMEQRALHETLNRLLWRYSMEHGGSKIDWDNKDTRKYRIVYNNGTFSVAHSWTIINNGCVHFTSKTVAEDAIATIVVPFIKDHPDFKW